jgi:hypothetical protein
MFGSKLHDKIKNWEIKSQNILKIVAVAMFGSDSCTRQVKLVNNWNKRQNYST